MASSGSSKAKNKRIKYKKGVSYVLNVKEAAAWIPDEDQSIASDQEKPFRKKKCPVPNKKLEHVWASLSKFEWTISTDHKLLGVTGSDW